MKTLMKIAALSVLAAGPVCAQDALPQVLFTNVNVFDGVNEALIEYASVLVEGNKIKTVSTGAVDAPDATVIDGGGRTLTPGFVEAHAHFVLMGPSVPAMEAQKTWEDFGIHASKMAEMYLMQGFTTVRKELKEKWVDEEAEKKKLKMNENDGKV